jgi:8-oxo-dGTP pyrophosphatase MutT (NUDIX family)
MEKHFTATVYIFEQGKVLLHYHEKLAKWLPPGGHIEPNETPPEAARREVKEETGLDIEFIEQENLHIEAYNAKSFVRPFLCLLENIPEHKGKPAHQHMDMIYLARPLLYNEIKEGFKWVSFEELSGMDLFPDTREVLHFLLNHQRRAEVEPLSLPRFA